MPNPHPDHLNLYAPPTTSLDRPEEPVGVDEAAYQLRQRFLVHEATFGALGMVHYFGMVLELVFLAVACYATFPANGLWQSLDQQSRTTCVINLFVATPGVIVVHAVLGSGLRRFQDWAFRGQVILSLATLLSFFGAWAIGWTDHPLADFMIVTTILFGIAHFAVLYYLLSSKCRRIVEPDYHEAVAAIPWLKGHWNWPLVIGFIPFSILVEWGFLTLSHDVSLLATWGLSLATA